MKVRVMSGSGVWVLQCLGMAVERRKKIEEKMGSLSGVWVVECVFCEKGARRRNHGGKKNK